MVTPQRRINDVFQAIEEAVASYGQLVPFFTPNDLTMSLKSSLNINTAPPSNMKWSCMKTDRIPSASFR